MAGCENLATKQDIRRLERKISKLEETLRKILEIVKDISIRVSKIIQLINTLERVLLEAISSAREIIVTAINNSFKTIRKLIESIFGLIKSLLAPDPPEIDYQRIRRIANSASNRAVDRISRKLRGLSQKIESAKRQIINRLSPIAQRTLFIKNAVTKILRILRNLDFPDFQDIKNLLNKILRRLQPIAQRTLFTKNAVQQIKSIANQILRAVRNLGFQDIRNLLNKILRRLQPIAQRTLFIKNAVEQIKSIVNKILKALNNLKFPDFPDLQEIKNQLNRILRKLQPISQRTLFIQNAISQVKSIVSGVDRKVSGLGQKIDNVLNRLLNRLEPIAQRTLSIDNRTKKILNIVRNLSFPDLQDIRNQLTRIRDDIKPIAERSLKTNNTVQQIWEKLKPIDLEKMQKQIKKILNILGGRIQLQVTRIHNILGGQRWFRTNEDVTPNLILDGLESKLKYSATTQGLDSGEGRTAIQNDLIDLLNNQISIPYYRAGGSEYPANLPKSIVDSDESQITVSNSSQFFEWYIKQFDAIAGQFPIDIKIKDNDLIQVENQELELSLPNLAETLAELVGTNITNQALNNAILSVLLRDLAETGSNRILNVKQHALLEAISEYLGYETGKKKQKVPFTFNPVDVVGDENNKGGIESLSKAMEAKEIDVPIDINKDNETLEQKLETLIEAARITKAQNFRTVDASGDIKSQLLDIIKRGQEFSDQEKEPDEDGKTEFDRWLENIEQGFTNEPGISDPNKPYGKDRDRRPRIRKIGEEDND